MAPDMPLLLHGDCLQLLQRVPDNSVDLVLTDPPFGCTKAEYPTAVTGQR